MMISIDRPSNRQQRSARSEVLIALEPPRHSSLPVSYLGAGRHLIGSSDDCAIQITAPGIQSQHAVISVSNNVIQLNALDPRTWVNDWATEEIALRAGDRISVGPVTYRIRFATTEELQNWRSLENHTNEDEVASSELSRSKNSNTSVNQRAVTPLIQDAALQIPVAESTVETSADHCQDDSQPLEGLRETCVQVVETSNSPVTANKIAAEGVAEFMPKCNAVHPGSDPPSTPFVSLPTQEIQQQIAALDEQAAVLDTTSQYAKSSKEELLFAARETELKRLADELTRQAQRLRDRHDRLMAREVELERKQAQLAAENERVVTTAETTRRELSDEYGRQLALWQEWDSAYRRTTEELTQQLEAVERRRSEIQIENEKLGNDRQEILRLHDEYDRERRAAASERVQAAEELSQLHALRASFETERRQTMVDLQDREAKLESERRALTVTEEELLKTRQEIEHDRTVFATERSAESLRREQEVREHTFARIRLNDEEAELQSLRYELESQQRAISEERANLNRDKQQFDEERSEIDELRAKLSHAEAELVLAQESRDAQRLNVELAEQELSRRQAELEDWQHNLETQQSEFESVCSSIRTEQKAFEAARAELLELISLATAEQLKSESSDASDDGDTSPSSPTVDRPLEISTSEDEEQPIRLPIDADSRSVSRSIRESDPMPLETVSLFDSPVPPPVPVMDFQTLADCSAESRGDFASLISVNPRTNEGSTTVLQAGNEPESMNDVSFAGGHSEMNRTVEGLEGTQIESATSSETAINVSQNPAVGETLWEIQNQFGYVASPATKEPVGLDESLWHDQEVSVQSSSHLGQEASDLENTAEKQVSATEDESGSDRDETSLETLRSQLTQMFSLPDHANSCTEEPAEPEVSSSNQCASDERYTIDERSGDQDSNESVPTISEVLSTIESSPVQSTPADSNHDSTEVEDPWTRRLRELSQVTEQSSARSEASVSQTVQEATPVEPSNEDEYSVEAQLARLLGRPLPPGGIHRVAAPQPDSTPDQQSMLSSGQKGMALVAAEEPAPVTDRSHLASEPTHKQDKSAVREEVQSFRAVAQMSARTALAKHSWKHLRNDFYFTASIATASCAASIWFLGAYFCDLEKDLWKGVTCAIGTAVCMQRLIASSAKLSKTRQGNVEPSLEKLRSAPKSEE